MASGYVTKEWKDRITEFPTRRQLAVVSETGSGMTVDVTRAEGLVSQEGDAYSAANMNGMEQRVKAAFDNVDTDVAGANSAVSGLTTRVGNAESNISGLTTRMGTAESNISGLGTRMGSAESNITKISGDLSGLKDDIPDPPAHLYQTSTEVSVSAGKWKNNNMSYTNKSGRMCLVFYDVLFTGSGEIHVSTTNNIHQSDRGSSSGEGNRHVSICAPLSPNNSIGCNVWASVSGTFTIKIQIIRL